MSRRPMKATAGRLWSALCQGLAGPGMGLVVQAQLPGQAWPVPNPAGRTAAPLPVQRRQARALGLRGVQA